MYQENRPRFRTYKKNRDSNNVRAINVHQLNRINWESDYINIDDDGNIIPDDVNDIDDEKDLLDKNSQFEDVSDEVLRTVKYRNDMRKRDLRNGQDTIQKIKRKYGEDVDVNNKSLEEIESDGLLKEKYYDDKNYRTRDYPYGYDETDIYERDLAQKYPQWFPELSKKYGTDK